MTNIRKDKILGCLLGGAIGDAIGGKYDGQDPPQQVSWSRPGRISDDTQLTMATCEAIIEHGCPTPAGISQVFLRWFNEGKLTGLGSATLGALKGLANGGHWALVGRRGEMAAGNGAAMRIAPLAFWVDPMTNDGRLLVRDVSRITHHSDEAYSGALAVVLAVRFILTRQWNGESNLLKLIYENLPDTLVRERLECLASETSEKKVGELAQKYGCSGFVAESVPLALWAAQQVKKTGFETMIGDLVKCGGDTDTNASIAGQVAGCLLGAKALPSETPLDRSLLRRLEALVDSLSEIDRFE